MSYRPCVIAWTIFYDDSSVYTERDARPDELPIDGVQWIVEFLEGGGKRNVHGMDYYRWTGDSWAGGHMGDLKKWFLAYKPESKWAREQWTVKQIVEVENWIRNNWPKVKIGLWISDEEYQKVREIVQDLKYGG